MSGSEREHFRNIPEEAIAEVEEAIPLLWGGKTEGFYIIENFADQWRTVMADLLERGIKSYREELARQ